MCYQRMISALKRKGEVGDRSDENEGSVSESEITFE